MALQLSYFLGCEGRVPDEDDLSKAIETTSAVMEETTNENDLQVMHYDCCNVAILKAGKRDLITLLFT